jgi:hypothetical protein
MHAIVLRIAEICINIVSHVFDPDDILSPYDMYAMRLASRGFTPGLIDVVTLQSIRVWWVPPYRADRKVGSTRPVDGRPQFDAREVMSGLQLRESSQRWLVKEMRVATFDTLKHEGEYPFGDNRAFLAELIAQWRSRMGGNLVAHTMRLIICVPSIWDWAMISGITEGLVDIHGIHIECELPPYFPVFTLDGPGGLPGFQLKTITNDTNPGRIDPSLNVFPPFACDTLVWNQPRFDSDLLALLDSSPR